MPRKCILPSCRVLLKDPSCRVFRLPRPKILKEIWFKILSPLIPPSGHQRLWDKWISFIICSRHFEAKYIRNNKRISLAAPTLFTEEEIETGIPNSPFKEFDVHPTLEHNYCERNFELRSQFDHNYCRDPKLEDKDNEIFYPRDQPAQSKQQENETEDWPDDEVHINGLEHNDQHDVEPIPSLGVGTLTVTTHESKPNKVQYYINKFIDEIKGDPDCNPPKKVENGLKRFSEELKKYNFSTHVLYTNKEVKAADVKEHLIDPEKAYAAITYCLLQQQEMFKYSIQKFLKWAADATLDYGSVEEKIIDIFQNGEFLDVSFDILQIVCKYRLINTELRIEGIADQILDPDMKILVSKIRNSTTHLFDEVELKSTLQGCPKNFHKGVEPKPRQDKATQVNMLLRKKADKNIQVKPKPIRKAVKSVQVNTNEIDGISTGHKVKRKDAGSQTSDKDKLLPATTFPLPKRPLKERSENVKKLVMRHCKKIQYVVNIKKKRMRPDRIAKRSINVDGIVVDDRDQAGPRHVDFQLQAVSSEFEKIESNVVERADEDSRVPKKKRKTSKRPPDPSMPVLWDACQNLLSLGGGTIETESEVVHSTLERKDEPRNRPKYGKKRRPKIPKELREPTQSPPPRHRSPDFHESGTSGNGIHICDSPYLLGGCKHTYDPQMESVPPSSYRSQSALRTVIRSSGGKRGPGQESSRSYYSSNVWSSEEIQDAPVVLVSQNPSAVETSNLTMTYDKGVLRWT